jgi:hypothetical protein
MVISALGGILATPDLHAATRVYPGGRDVVVFESFSKSRVELCPCIPLLTMAMAAESPISSPVNPIRQEPHDEERKKRFSGGVSIVVRLCLSPFHYQHHRSSSSAWGYGGACRCPLRPASSAHRFFFRLFLCCM